MNDLSAGGQPTPAHIVDLRLALADVINKAIATEQLFEPGDAAVAVLQLGAAMASALPFEKQKRIEWAAKNFFSAFGELCAVEFQLDAVEGPVNVQ